MVVLAPSLDLIILRLGGHIQPSGGLSCLVWECLANAFGLHNLTLCRPESGSNLLVKGRAHWSTIVRDDSCI
jgi:hypothetical protein